MKRLTKELKPHPLNADIYDDGADDKLIQSIRENGILEPLIVDHKNRIISGHRRWDAARKLELKDLPVELFKSQDELDIQTALVEANRQRIKTNEQLAREAAQIFKIEQEKARARQISANLKGTLMAKSPEGGGTARDLAGQKVGMGGKKVEQSVQVIEAIDRLKKDGEHDIAKKLQGELNKFSVSRAHNVAREMGQLKAVSAPPPTAEDFILIKRWRTMTKADQQKALVKGDDKGIFNYQETDGIEWARWSWNPITGCNHGCDYCYARDIANRMFDAKFEPAFYPGRLQCPTRTEMPTEAKEDIGQKNVFTCSMADLFGKWVPKDLIEMVLDVVRQSPQWNFLFLTKFPQRLLEFEFPDNAWVGTSVDTQRRVKNAEEVFKNVKAKVKWLSCEPMMEDLTFAHLDRFQWVVIGGSSRSTQTPEFHPPREWVTHLWAQARAAKCMIYEKPNLLERCREYPKNDDSNRAPLDLCVLKNIDYRNMHAAYHEASHAVVGVTLGDKPESVTINVEKPHYKPEPDSSYVTFLFTRSVAPPPMGIVINKLTLLMAGVMAQHRLCPEFPLPEIWRVFGSGDKRQMKALLLDYGPFNKSQKKEMHDKATEESRKLVYEHWSEIQSLAKVLYEKTTLQGKEIIDVINQPLSAKEEARWKAECDSLLKDPCGWLSAIRT